jgi:hypothetical protein
MIRGSMKKAMLLAAALATTFAHAVRAQDATSVPTAATAAAPTDTTASGLTTRRYRIESISVTGARRASAPRVIVAESRLLAGRDYSEDDLRDAVRRIKRLPFVLEARPTLRRGSLPGLYELVLQVEETSPFAGTAALWLGLDGGPHFGTTSLSADRFVGASSRLFVSGTLEDIWHGSVQAFGPEGDPAVFTFPPRIVKTAALGFQQYDVLGRGSRLSLDVSTQADSSWRTERAGTSLLLPVGRNHSVVVATRFARRKGDLEPAGPPPTGFGERLQTRFNPDLVRVTNTSSVRWIYNTTEDPFAPLEGTFLSATLELESTLRSDSARAFGGRPLSPQFSEGFSVRHAFRLGSRLAVEAQVNANCFTSDDDNCENNGIGGVLRYVRVGRGNRTRVFAEVGAFVEDWRFGGLEGTVRATAGVRTPFAAISFSLIRRFDRL